ncbi:MAG: NADPH-dependent glutamate synthase [Bifidobacteriaceae bacterium]|nr:NADPH-dependent glutamate synthase [Bifidobacteriaceae bacterium]
MPEVKKINRQKEKTPMPQLSPEVRITNFDEVALGLDREAAINEAMRCLGCPDQPCVGKCPVGVPIPAFINCIVRDNPKAAIKTIKRQNLFPAICGRVCPQESQCESVCVRARNGQPVGIGYLERYVADTAARENLEDPTRVPNPTGKKVAIVGSGPGGLAAAGELAKAGHAVTVFEALHKPGGVLEYGIPQFRLPKDIVAREVSKLKELGVRIKTNVIVGKSVTIDELLDLEGFDAVYIGSGAGLPTFMNIPGENFNGVFSANEYLTRTNLMKGYLPETRTPVYRAKKAAIVGGGNVAMDAARCARRLGADVTIIYRRSEAELPARAEEVEHAKEEGIKFQMLTSPVEIQADENNWVNQVKCETMILGEPDASGRRRPQPTGEYVTLECDCVIMAIGNSPNPLIGQTTPGLDLQKWGGIIVTDETTGQTTKSKVWAGGDAVSGAATVILALGAGKAAAKAINQYLKTAS